LANSISSPVAARRRFAHSRDRELSVAVVDGTMHAAHDHVAARALRAALGATERGAVSRGTSRRV